MSNASLLTHIGAQTSAMPDAGQARPVSGLIAAESKATPAEADAAATATMATVITSALAAHRRRLAAAAASQAPSARNAFD
ncbi:MAG: hypothetical protein ACKO01_11625 [Erythrobacter sp.]